jgi:hypothetical protein
MFHSVHGVIQTLHITNPVMLDDFCMCLMGHLFTDFVYLLILAECRVC